jgi:hypothetical protein
VLDDVVRVNLAGGPKLSDNCHFGEHAHEVLASLGVSAREIRVDYDEAAEFAGHGIPLAFMPVLTDGERGIAYGRFSEKRAAEGARALSDLRWRGRSQRRSRLGWSRPSLPAGRA